MTEQRRKSYAYLDGDFNYRVTRVSSTRTRVNEDSLKKELGARLFNKATKRVLDTKKLEALMDDGTLDPMIVGKHVIVTDSAPYNRITKSEVNPDGETA